MTSVFSIADMWTYVRVYSFCLTEPHGSCIKLYYPEWICLTRWGRVTHIRVGKLTNIGSDNGLSPGRRQTITWTNVGILLIGPLGTNFSEILIGIETFSFRKKHLKMSSAKLRPFCLGLNVLKWKISTIMTLWHGNACLCGGKAPVPTLRAINAECCFFIVGLNDFLNKQSSCRWLET